MGIVNLTPDSFSDGGAHPTPAAAIAHAHALVEAGATIIDLGAESTRPGATPVPPETERARLLPILAPLARAGLTLSIDTRNATTMHACLNEGAALINDVSALTHDPASAPLLATQSCQVILMHMRGTPATMDQHATYTDVVRDVRAELATHRQAAMEAGIAEHRILLDPGLGFAKTQSQSLTLLHNLKHLGTPLVVGASRKRFLGGHNPAARLGGSIAAAILAAQAGAAIVRVHDVAETVQALRVVVRPGALPLDPAGVR